MRERQTRTQMEVDVAENSKDTEETRVKRHRGQGSGHLGRRDGERESPVWMKPLPSTFLLPSPICPLPVTKSKEPERL